jgi:hypothetical protein
MRLAPSRKTEFSGSGAARTLHHFPTLCSLELVSRELQPPEAVMGATNRHKESPMNALEFREGDRTFTCKAESSPATPGTLWWWVSITGESQRYAAFRTAEGDGPANLPPRIVAYYAQMVADRERPREIRTHWGKRRMEAKPGEAAAPAESPPKP